MKQHKPVLSIDLVKAFPTFTLKAAADFGPGITALFGPSGSGKTTLLDLIAGVQSADEGLISSKGEVFFNSIRGINLPPEQRKIGYVFQENALFPHMTVRQNLLFGAGRGEASREWSRLLKLFDLKKLLERHPGTLSGGEKKRTAIARALLSRPDILLLDEPLASIDGKRRENFFPYLHRLRREFDLPILYVSHQIDEVIRIADHLVLFEDGRILTHGPLAEVFDQTQVQLALGHANRGTLLEAVVSEVAGGLATLDFGAGKLVSADDRLKAGQKIRLRILAKDVAIATQSPKNLSILNVLACTVERLEGNFHHHTDLALALGNQANKVILHAEITRRSAVQLKLKKGMKVYALVKALAIISPAV